MAGNVTENYVKTERKNKMKKNLGKKNWMFPMPVLMIGSYDADKMKPICFDTCQHVYRLMGATVAKAFSCGKELM